ncbi:MAG: sulfatase [Planctomycetota bacterium]|jgi:arylsulfatase
MAYNKPNIILIVVDALRADHLSCYGYDRLTSPNLDRFAEECLLFKSAFSASPSTVGSIPSILTGLYPSFHGTGVDGNVFTLRREISTLPQLLREDGYTTVGFNTNPYMASKHGYSRGYTSYFDLFVSKPKLRAEEANRQVAAWLENDGRRPFFMWIHYLDTHGPYFPREPYFSEYSNSNKDDRLIPLRNEPVEMYAKLCKEPGLSDFQQRQLVIDCYDSEIRYFDGEFERLLSLLRRHCLLDNTILFVTSDHGEEFWEHGVWGHPMNLYDINIHVPLLIRYPPFAAKRKTIFKQVRNIDIFPTVLDILSIEPGHYPSGVSLRPYMENESSAPEVAVISEGGGLKGISVDFYIDRVRAIRTPQWKYIKNITQNTSQLYQLQDDPDELVNLVHELHAQLIIRDLDLQLSDLLKSPPRFDVAASLGESDAHIIERLKALGYV